MKTEIRERRSKMLNLYGKGVKLSTLVSDLAREYRVKQHTVYVDWGRRGEWLEDIVGLKNAGFGTIIISNVKQIVPNAWKEFLTAPSSRERVNALRLILDVNTRMFEMLQSLGKIAKVPEKFEAKMVEPIIVRMWTPEEQKESESSDE